MGNSAKITTDQQLAAFARDFDLPDDLVAGYRTLMPHAPVLDVYLTIFGDLMFGEYSIRLAERQAQSGGRAFVSRFARARTGPGQVVRPWHCADISFAFGTIDNPDLAFLIGGTPNAADRDLSSAMVRTWADFAATGNPGWRPAADYGTQIRVWETEGHAATDDYAETRALWHDVDFPLLRP